MSLTKPEADKLRKLIGEHTAARVAEAWAGTSPPDEAMVIRADARHATRALGLYIKDLETGHGEPDLLDVAEKILEGE